MDALLVSLLLVSATAADLFEAPAFKSVRIEIGAEGIEHLRASPRNAVPAKLQIGDEVREDVSARLKGRGSFLLIEEKPSFTITRSSAPTKFHLNNSVEDASYLKEKIGSEVFRANGIPAPYVGHAHVKLNGKDLGLYVLKEGFTRKFVARSFDDATGRLYDNDEGIDVDQPM